MRIVQQQANNNSVVKKLLVSFGLVSLGLGIAGAFLPILPTTPFILLSAWLFAKSSDKWHNWLMNHRIFGELLRDFHLHKAIPLHAKIISISMMWATILFAIFVPAADKRWLQIVLAVIATSVTVHILSYKTKKLPKKD